MLPLLEKFNIDDYSLLEEEKIVSFLRQNKNGFIFQKNIERAHHYSDLVYNYLEASYICEEVAKLGDWESFEIDWVSGYHPVAQFVFVPLQSQKLGQLLREICIALSGDDEDAVIDWAETIEGYRDEIKKRNLQFPELGSDYYANLINGGYNEYDSNTDKPGEIIDIIKKEDPEHFYGFWKYPDSLRNPFYVSTESWIIPPGTDFHEVLSEHSAITNPSFEDGYLFSLNSRFHVINENYVLLLSFPGLAKAVQCIGNIFKNLGTFENRHDWLYSLNGVSKVFVADFANFIMVDISGYLIILWNAMRLNFNEINKLNKDAAVIFHTTSKIIGLVENISCDWGQLSDESFEELCYDIIYYNPKFNNETIRKMGKANSRDGGRDIVVYTQSRVGYEPEKYIFQCKLTKPGSSLSGSKVTDISDVVEQHDVKGYGIFTSGVIDATLYDKIDSIAKRKKIETDLFSIYEIERLLSIYPKLKERYFDKQ